jgi:hypothetical protein
VMSLPGSHCETRTWNPDCRRGEGGSARSTLRRKDLWFFVGAALFLVLLFFIWHQNNSLRLAAEVARLELTREALRARVLEQGVQVTQLRQPAMLMADAAAGDLEGLDLAGRVYIKAPRRGEEPRSGGKTWLASVGLGVSQARAADGR